MSLTPAYQVVGAAGGAEVFVGIAPRTGVGSARQHVVLGGVVERVGEPGVS
jgi:hypothetical protein